MKSVVFHRMTVNEDYNVGADILKELHQIRAEFLNLV